MGIPVDMNGVQAWTPGNVLSPGTHTVKVTDAEEKSEPGRNPQIILSMEAIAGNESGGTVKDWLTITPNSLGRVRMVMEAFGVPVPPGQFNLEASAFRDRVAQIIVRSEPSRKDPSKSYSKVTGYEAAPGISGSNGAVGQGDPLDQVAGQPGQNGGQPVAAGAAPHDDIPF